MGKTPRPQYRPSGRFNFPRLLAALPVNLLAALALGGVMAAIGIWYTYAIVWVPVVVTIPLAALGYLSARWARMRNPILALVLGALLGAAMYFGQYVGQFVNFHGAGALRQPELLADFIADSVDHLIVYDLRDRVVRGTTAAHHWLFFSVEIGLCMLGTAFGWYIAAVSPYCESCGRFLRSRVAILPLGTGTMLAEFLAGQDTGELDIPEDVKGNRAFSRVELYGCQCGASSFITAMDYIPTTTCEPLQTSLLTPQEFQRVVEKYPQLSI
jgi:hypothetical protein